MDIVATFQDKFIMSQARYEQLLILDISGRILKKK